MRHTKLAVVMASAVLAVAGLAGCSSSNGKVKVVFWHTMGQSNQAWLNERIAEFNKIYPDVTIEHAAQGDYTGLKSKISSAIPAGTTPTMAFCYPDHVADYLVAGASEDLAPYISSATDGLGASGTLLADTGKSDFVPAYWEEGTKYVDEKGQALSGIYSLPFSKSTEVLFYNKTEFTKNGWTVPTTWAEMWALAAQIKTKYADVTPLGYDSDANMLITLFEQLGVPYTSATTDANTGHFLFNNADAKSLVTELKGYYSKGYFVTQGTSSSGSYTSTMFTKGAVKGGCLMTIGSTGGTTYNWPSKSADDTSGAFDVGVAELPQYDTNHKKIIMQGPSITLFKRASEQEKHYAWLLYKYLTNTDNSASYSFLTGYNPVRTSSYSSKYYDQYNADTMANTKYQLVHEVSQLANTLTNDYYVSPAFKGSTAARDQMNGILASVCNNNTSVDDAFSAALTACVFATNS
jgi:multiple sugar transport system substrate-binding protein